MSDTIVVTGGAGFIGSHVVDRLLSAGYQVEVIDDLSTGRESNLSPEVKIHKMDIRSPKLADLMMKLKPASVVHLAAQIDVRLSLREPVVDADVNILGGINVVQSAIQAGTEHIVFASSAATYGSPEIIPTPEDAGGRPASPYGVSKLAFEHYLHYFHHMNGIKTAILRFANVYGPRQTVKGEAGVVAIFIKKLMAGGVPIINGDGEQTRDYVYVIDVAEMVTKAVEDKLHGTFNVSTGQETSVNDLTDTLLEVADMKDAEIEHGPAVPNEDKRSCLAPDRAKEVAGWQSQVSVKDGLGLTFQSAKDDPDFIKK